MMTQEAKGIGALRVCAVDIGTNSTRSIVADVRPPAAVEVIHYDGRITRLGKGLGTSRTLKPEAIERTTQAAATFVEHGRRLGATAFKLVATSAARDADNGDTLLAAIRNATGLEVQVASGRREAELVLAGVRVGGLLGPGPCLVADVGGGSTELIAHRPHTPPEVRSVNVGAVRLSERFLTTDPPTEEEIAAASSAVEASLGPEISAREPVELIGLGGTITTMVAMLKKLDAYDAAKVHGHTLTLDETETLLAETAARRLDERKKIPGLSPARADIIIGGIIIVRALLRAARCEAMRVSTTGILCGIALAAAGA